MNYKKAQRLLLCSLILQVFLFNIQAQDSNTFFSNWKLGISYFGNNAWNPGLQFSGEKVIREKLRTKTRREKTKVKFRQHVIDAKLGLYYDNPTHIALFNNYTYNFRRVRNKGKLGAIKMRPRRSKKSIQEEEI